MFVSDLSPKPLAASTSRALFEGRSPQSLRLALYDCIYTFLEDSRFAACPFEARRFRALAL